MKRKGLTVTFMMIFKLKKPSVSMVLSPARRGRGILVASGFCPASRFLVGAKTQKTTGHFFLNFNMTFLATWGCASDFLKMLPKFKMAADVNSKKIVVAKTLKLNVIPHNMEMCR